MQFQIIIGIYTGSWIVICSKLVKTHTDHIVKQKGLYSSIRVYFGCGSVHNAADTVAKQTSGTVVY